MEARLATGRINDFTETSSKLSDGSNIIDANAGESSRTVRAVRFSTPTNSIDSNEGSAMNDMSGRIEDITKSQEGTMIKERKTLKVMVRRDTFLAIKAMLAKSEALKRGKRKHEEVDEALEQTIPESKRQKCDINGQLHETLTTGKDEAGEMSAP